ncbi:MAG TPA: tetratricopeptide repeat protein [Smithellaceae bacterium]|nr:tetratricopeptide repeat protein [Smithellaceae bacterium]
MGKKQDRRGKYVHLFFACFLIIPILQLFGCAHYYNEMAAATDFEQAENFTRQGNYNAAAAKYENIAESYPGTGDRALFQAGVIYMLPQNKRKDYRTAWEYFRRLVNKYPKSSYRQDSEIFISLINEINNRDKKISTQHKQINKLEQQTNKLEQHVEEIEKKLELMKKIDMNLKKKKKILR